MHEASPFEDLVARAAARLPEEFQRVVSDVAIIVSTDGAVARAYGLYSGDTVARGDAPTGSSSSKTSSSATSDTISSYSRAKWR